MIELKDVSVAYGDTVAVDSVSLTVPEGQILALLGPSGCGKSSLLRALAGLVPATGTILIDSLDMSHVPVHRRRVGMVFQSGQLFTHRNVAGNIRYGMTGEKKTERVAELLDLVGLPGYENRAVSTLSGGQAQRVALARSLAARPEVLLFDEPLSALDRSLREKLSEELRQIITSTGVTSIYVTHDQDEALAVADSIAIMDMGRIVAEGTGRELMASSDPGIRDFLGSSTLARCVVTDSDGTTYRAQVTSHIEARGEASVGDDVYVRLRPLRAIARDRERR